MLLVDSHKNMLLKSINKSEILLKLAPPIHHNSDIVLWFRYRFHIIRPIDTILARVFYTTDSPIQQVTIHC